MGGVNLLAQDGPAAVPATDLLQQLQTLSWVDHTALGVMLVFFVLGLFKGLIWQVSRIAILVAAYVIAGRFGNNVARLLSPAAAPVHGPNPPGTLADGGLAGVPGAGGEGPGDTTIYLAYVLVFVAVLVVLSLLAILLQKLAAKAGLSFFDRLGGGVFGVATGACVVLFGLSVVYMFFRDSQLAIAAESSHSLRLTKRAVDLLGDRVPDELRGVFALSPLHPQALGSSLPAAHGPARAPDLPPQPRDAIPGTAPGERPKK